MNQELYEESDSVDKERFIYMYDKEMMYSRIQMFCYLKNVQSVWLTSHF